MYEVRYVSGHDLTYKVKRIDAQSKKEAVSKALLIEGANFDNRVMNVRLIRDYD